MDVEWFKGRKKEGRITDADLAAALGVERSVANKVVNGKVGMDARRAAAVGRLFGVSRDEVLFRAGLSSEAPTQVVSSPDEDDDVEMVGIQHIDLEYGLGATFADGHVDVEVLKFPQVWVRTITHSPPELLTWTRGRGDSMQPTIHDGDLVMLDRSQRVIKEADAIWAFTVGEIAAIKRLRLKGDRVQIFSDNASVPPDEEPLSMVNIVGRVVFVGSRK